MKETLKLEDPKRVSNEFFDFHDKVNKILEVALIYINNSIFYTMLTKGSGRNFCYPYGCNKGKFIKRKKNINI
jgi:hypothetical protein